MPSKRNPTAPNGAAPVFPGAQASAAYSCVSTKFWHSVDDNRVQCDVCPRACRLNEGQAGLCFVRSNRDGKVVLDTFGRSSGFCVDPIEKKPLYHFLPGTPVLSFGTAGCNLACKFCQNWDVSKSRDVDILATQAMPRNIVDAALANDCRSIAYTYNDPVIFLEYAIAVAAEAKAHGIYSIAVTAGYINPSARSDFFQYMDAANIDLKAFSDRFYYKVCGGRLAHVLDTLTYVKHQTNVWLEITTLLIPGENDSTSELKALSRWIFDNLGPETPVHFTAFHPDWRMLAHSPTPPSSLSRARAIARDSGLKYVYTGNVDDEAGGATHCPQCDCHLIGRSRFTLTHWALGDGVCPKCSTPINGLFEASPGKWGSRRVPIDITQFTHVRP